jgi:hypothetical protein
MRSILLALPLLCLAGVATGAPYTPVTKTHPTLFLGLSWTFSEGLSNLSGTPGISLKVLSTDRRNSGAAAAGVTYNFDGTIGCDLGLGYNSAGSMSLTLGYDICKRAPQFGIGGSGRAHTSAPPVT